MSLGRGSVRCAAVAVAFVPCLVLAYVENVRADAYTVGDSAGGALTWPVGLKGSALELEILSSSLTIRRVHNVVAVNRASYSSCTIPAGAKVYTSGKDQIKLVKGLNFFICSIDGHCQSGMKIAINAV